VLAPRDVVSLGQPVQFTAAASCENVFTPQSVQATEPIVFLYVPASHGWHSDPSGPVYPTRHVQTELPAGQALLAGHAEQVVDAIAATATEKVFTPHGMQDEEPVYVPEPQGVHSTPTAPVYPERHVQLELPASEKVSFGHGEQVLGDIAEVTVE
jgi:hypothetical protein